MNERARPDYDPLGARIGGFLVYPRVRTGLGFTDNAFLAAANRQSDAFLDVAPGVAVQSDWSLHELAIRAGGDFQRYLNNPRRNQNGWNVGLRGRYDLSSNAAINGDAQIARLYESPLNGDVQSNLAVLSSYLRTYAMTRAAHTWGRSRATLAVDRTSLDFASIDLGTGVVRNQSDRNRVIVRATGQFDYALTPSTSFYGQVGYARTDYSRGLLSGLANRDANSWRAVGGINLDLAGFLRGRLGVGYIRRDYDSVLYRTVSGVSVEARVEFFPTELTTFTVVGGRSLQDANIGNSSAFYDNRLSARVDHELLRNLVVNASAEGAIQDYTDSPFISRVLRIGSGAKYLVSPLFDLEARVSYTARTQNGGGLGGNFNEFGGTVSLVLHP